MEALKIYERVKERFPDKVLEVSDRKPDPFAVVAPDAIVAIGRFLCGDPETAMDCLNNETGVDYKDRIEVVYHLFSYKHRHGCVLKVRLPRDNPVIPTVEEIWRAADWMEREIFDLLGVTFVGSPMAGKKLLLPDNYPPDAPPPLRKESNPAQLRKMMGLD